MATHLKWGLGQGFYLLKGNFPSFCCQVRSRREMLGIYTLRSMTQNCFAYKLSLHITLWLHTDLLKSLDLSALDHSFHFVFRIKSFTCIWKPANMLRWRLDINTYRIRGRLIQESNLVACFKHSSRTFFTCIISVNPNNKLTLTHSHTNTQLAPAVWASCHSHLPSSTNWFSPSGSFCDTLQADTVFTTAACRAEDTICTCTVSVHTV